MMLLIVLIHSDYIGHDDIGSITPLAADFIYYISQTVARVAVPLFFAISGFLFFYDKNVKTPGFYRTQMRKRVHSLLIPYLLWNLIAICFNWIKTLPCMASFFPRMVGKTFGLKEIVNEFGPFNFTAAHGALGAYDPASAPADIPLWFIRDLLAIILFTPIIYHLVKGRAGNVTISLLLLLFFTGIWPENCFWFSLSGVTFFCLGAYFSVNRIDVIDCLGGKNATRSTIFWASLFIITSVARLVLRESPFSSYLLAATIMTGVPCFIVVCASAARRNWRPGRFILNVTFFMYAFHGIINTIVKRLAIRLIDPVSSFQFIFTYLSIAAMLVGISFMVYYIVAKVTPGFAALLIGKKKSQIEGNKPSTNKSI